MSFSYLVGIPYINRIDLLQEALKSIELYLPYTVIIDNSENGELSNHDVISELVSIHQPEKPLTHVESMNLFQEMAKERQCDVVMYMHTDARAEEGIPQALLDLISDLKKQKRKWGIIYTNYDAIAAYNMEAIREVGAWDTTFVSYFGDWDWYYRIKQAGYELIDSHLPVFHHLSSSNKSDPRLQAETDANWGKWRNNFIDKWGQNVIQEAETIFLTLFYKGLLRQQLRSKTNIKNPTDTPPSSSIASK